MIFFSVRESSQAHLNLHSMRCIPSKPQLSLALPALPLHYITVENTKQNKERNIINGNSCEFLPAVHFCQCNQSREHRNAFFENCHSHSSSYRFAHLPRHTKMNEYSLLELN